MPLRQIDAAITPCQLLIASRHFAALLRYAMMMRYHYLFSAIFIYADDASAFCAAATPPSCLRYAAAATPIR